MGFSMKNTIYFGYGYGNTFLWTTPNTIILDSNLSARARLWNLHDLARPSLWCFHRTGTKWCPRSLAKELFNISNNSGSWQNHRTSQWEGHHLGQLLPVNKCPNAITDRTGKDTVIGRIPMILPRVENQWKSHNFLFKNPQTFWQSRHVGVSNLWG